MPSARQSYSATLDEVLRSSLTCQLACIACAEAGLRIAVLKPHSSLVRACLKCLEACMALSHVVALDGYQPKDSAGYLLLCIDACATCEAECLASKPEEPFVQRCQSACSKLRDRCRQLLGSATLPVVRVE